MNMLEKINTLWPEIILVGTAFAVMLIGLSSSRAMQRCTSLLAACALIVAGCIVGVQVIPDCSVVKVLHLPSIDAFSAFIKISICAVGLILLLLACELPDEFRTGDGSSFGSTNSIRGEFFGFFLLSLAGVMLCISADDLIWLFLSLELTSLPTYVMVATMRDRVQAPEAAVKYFFLGAFASAIFLYGFTLIYGATGTTFFSAMGVSEQIGITGVFAERGMSNLALIGMVMAIVGVCFKIVAVPMHVYAADVYQGAATPVTAFLAFVPKLAGFVTLIVLLRMIGWPLEHDANASVLTLLLWIIAVATMFVGNTFALQQTNVKRILAYSSVAHSGYMLIGLTVGIGSAASNAEAGIFYQTNGIAALLFYIMIYGIMNIGAFGVLGILKADGEDCETFDDLRGLVRHHPLLATIMAVSVLGLAGIPPLVGFFGKVYIFGAAIANGYIWLAVLGVINSAIAAVYYLRIIGVCFLAGREISIDAQRTSWRHTATLIAALIVIVLSIWVSGLIRCANAAGVLAARSSSTMVDINHINTEHVATSTNDIR